MLPQRTAQRPAGHLHRLSHGLLTPSACVFTEAGIREVIELHLHHHDPLW
ncbi:hypothetical protein [Streptomyces goshikiensis]